MGMDSKPTPNTPGGPDFLALLVAPGELLFHQNLNLKKQAQKVQRPSLWILRRKSVSPKEFGKILGVLEKKAFPKNF